MTRQSVEASDSTTCGTLTHSAAEAFADYLIMAQQPVLWKKRILVPFWILRILIMVFIIIVYALTLRNIDDYKDVIKPAVA